MGEQPTYGMDTPLHYQQHLDELIAFATAEARKPDLLQAKAQYFELTGEVFEDDRSFEMRMASFLDFYLFDRPQPGNSKTPAQEFLEVNQADPRPERVSALRAFTETVHGIFEVRKLAKGLVRLRELFSDKDYDVTERRSVVALQKGDILEARLVPFAGNLIFSAAFCYHPREAISVIKKEVKRRRKKEPERSPLELVYEAAKRAIKADRYRQIAVEKIYDFQSSKL
jgi:hypothetical protein